MDTTIRWETAQVVPVGPGTKFGGTEGVAPEEWEEKGEGVQIVVDVGPYIGTLIVPFTKLGDTEDLMHEIKADRDRTPLDQLKRSNPED